MAGATTLYDVQLRYVLDDQTMKGRRALGAGLDEMKTKSSDLQDHLKRLAATAAGLFGIREAKKVFVDFNSSMEQAKITTAGMMELNVGGGFEKNLKRANELVDRLQVEAKTSIGTTQDMVQMLSMLTQPLTAAGASMDDLVSLTKGAVVASRALGINAAVGARDIDQAIRGQFHAVDQLTSKLLGPAGFFGEEGRRKFNAMTQKQRLEAVRGALTSPALTGMAEAQGKSWEGALSTLEDNLQITLGKVGYPLFSAITAELNKWNTWIEANGKTIDEMVNRFAAGLVEGFKYLKTVIDLIIDHKDLLISIGEAWLASKGVGMIAGAGGLGGMFGGWTKQMTDAAGATKTVGLGFGEMAGKLGGVTSGLALLAVGMEAFVGWMDKRQSDQLGRQLNGIDIGAVAKGYKASKDVIGDYKRFGEDALDMQANEAGRKQLETLYQQFVSTGTAGAGGIDEGKLAKQLEESPELMHKLADTVAAGDDERYGHMYPTGLYVPMGHEEMSKAVATDLGKALNDFFKTEWEARHRPENLSIPAQLPAAGKGPPVNNIHINRIEVASDDPDRFIFQFTKLISDATKNRSQSRHTIREGG